MYELYIANKNYSSWSLRPWCLMRELAIPFREQLLVFGEEPLWREYRRRVRSGKVPSLIDADTVVWDSLAISEYLAERHAGVWPHASPARAFARSAAAEMHSGFAELRSRCSMTCGLRVRLNDISAGLKADLQRLEVLWSEGLERFGGPFLAGDAFTAADAFFAPVAFRVQTYALPLSPTSRAYVQRLLDTRSLRDWYRAALEERSRDLPHEAEIRAVGEVLEDLRAS